MNLNCLATLLEKLSSFHLELLSKEWVELVWSSGFSPPIEVPSDFELQFDSDPTRLAEEVRALVKLWLEEDGEAADASCDSSTLAPRKSWNRLSHKVDHKALVCLLSGWISQYDQGSEEEDAATNNARAVQAARLYLALLSVEGSHVFQVFQGTVYQQCLEIFKCLTSSNSTIATIPQRGRGRKKNADTSMTNGGSPDLVGDSVVKPCCLLIDDLCDCVSRFSMGTDDSAFSQTIQFMVQVAGTEKRVSSFSSHCPPRNTTAYLAFKAYSVLESLCTPYHGCVSDISKGIMRALLPSLCIYNQNNFQQLSKDSIVAKDHSVNFIMKLIRKSSETHQAAYILIQQLCMRIPDRADVRTKYIDIIIDILDRFPYALFYKCLLFLCSLCVSDLVRHRLLGVEIVSRVIYLAPKFVDESLASNSTGARSSANSRFSRTSSVDSALEKCQISHKFLFSLIVNMCKDISPRIRIKSLSILSNLLRSRDPYTYEIVEDLFVLSIDMNNKEMFDFSNFFKNLVKGNEELSIPSPVPTAGAVINLIETLCQDSKALIRKNALHVVADICMLHQSWITSERLNLLTIGCKDLSVGNRKMMAQCLTDLLLDKPDQHLLISAWVDGVVPLFAENEVKAQEKVLELANSVILDNIVPLDETSTVKDKLPWNILYLITERNYRKLFKYACQQWSQKNNLKPQLIMSLQSFIGSEYNVLAWYFIVCISEFQDLPNPEAVLSYFYDRVYNQSSVNELESEFVMEALVLNWRKLKKDQISQLCHNLKSSLMEYETPLPLISGCLDIVHLNDRNNIKQWAEPILLDCGERLKQRVKKVVLEECYSDSLLCRYIFMLGELCQVCPDHVDLDTINALANLIDLANLEEAQLEKSLSNFGYVQAVAVTTLGKLSLQNQFTAKAVVPILGALVRAKSPSAIKRNANIALTDLCIRFSSLVEPFFSDMFVCLKDPDPVVRKSTLDLITQLIQEQYLKLKPHVFVYLLSMLLDPLSDMKEFASSFLVNSLMAKDPNVFHTNFCQTIFLLNGYEGSSRERMSPLEKSMFCLVGDRLVLARRELYLFMLQHMDDVTKFKTKYRLCTEILNPILEDKIPLRESNGEPDIGVIILKDTLSVLGCDEIKMTIRKGGFKDGGVDDEDDDNMAEAVVVARKKVMSQLYSSLTKRNLIDNIIPIFKRLKQKLASQKSPLVGDVIDCLREILKDFSRDQVEEILEGDPDLAAEVLYALRNQQSEGGPGPDEGGSQEEPPDAVMEQMDQVAKSITCTVMLHGPQSLATRDGQMEDEAAELLSNVSISSAMVTASTPLQTGGVEVAVMSGAGSSQRQSSLQVTPRVNGVNPRYKRKGRAPKQGGGSRDRSDSIQSDRSDCNTSCSSLSSFTSSSSSSGSSSSRKRKR